MANAVTPDLQSSGSQVSTKIGAAKPTARQMQSVVYPPISQEEWQERGKRILAMLDEWIAEGPQEDLATWEELEAGLKASPVRFRKVTVDG